MYFAIKAGLISVTDDCEKLSNTSREIDRSATIDHVMDKIIKHFPTATENQLEFLYNNKELVKDLVNSSDTCRDLKKYLPTICSNCKESLVEWKHKTKNSYIISIGEMIIVKLPVNLCSWCKVLYYPDLYHVGIVPVHHKFLLSYDYILELAYLLDSGVSLIEVIKSKLSLLASREKLSFEPDNNSASMIERVAVGFNSLIITGKDTFRCPDYGKIHTSAFMEPNLHTCCG